MKNKLFMLAALTAAVGVTSCTKDADYDNLFEKDSIDLSMKVAQGLTLPIGSTDKIYLSKVLDINKTEMLMVDEEGNFCFKEDGSIKQTKLTIEQPSIKVDPKLKDAAKYSFTVNQSSLPQEIQNTLFLYPEGYHFDEFKELSVTLSNEDLEFSDKTKFELKQSNIDPAILSISRAEVDPVDVEISLNLSDLPEMGEVISFDELTIKVPEYLVVKEETAPGVINLQIEDLTPNSTKDKVFSTHLTVIAIDFTRSAMKALEIKNGVLEISDDIEFSGSASISGLKISGSDFVVKLDDNKNKTVQLDKNIEISILPEIKVSEILFTKVAGHFQPEFNIEETKVKLHLDKNIDFFQSEENVFDIQNPEVKFNINILNGNTVPEKPIMANVVITVSNDLGETVKFKSIELPIGGLTEVKFDKSSVENGDLTTFITPIPNEISVSVDVKVDSENEYEISIGKENTITIDMDYAISIPLAFNKLDFTYDQKVEDVWGKDRTDITDMVPVIPSAKLFLSIENAIPLNLDVEIVGTWYGNDGGHTDGEEVAGLVTFNVSNSSSTNAIIPAGTLNTPNNANVVVEFALNDTKHLKDLIIRFKGKGNNAVFNTNEYFQIKESHVEITNGIIIDLND